MSKMKELSMVLDELVTCGETLISTANALKKIFSSTPDDEKPPAKNSKKAPAKSKAETATDTPEENPAPKPITKEQVRGILAAKSAAGHSDEIRALLEKFGAKQLKQVDPSDYEALIKEAEKIGTDKAEDTEKDEVDDDE